jgi:hypothetical protein
MSICFEGRLPVAHKSNTWIEGEDNPAQWGGLDGKENSGHRKSVFSLTRLWNLPGVSRVDSLMRWSIYDLEEVAFLVCVVIFLIKPILQAETVDINIA